MLFSYLTRFISKKPQQSTTSHTDINTALNDFAIKEGGKFFPNFKLFHGQTTTHLDMLLFLPNLGIFIGETIDWHASDLENATVERSSKRIKRPAATHFESSESNVRRKLEDVLSFDSTSIERFLWMKNLTEAEFDELDPSFHEQLPKSRLIFSNESLDSIATKFNALAEYRQEPYSTLKIIGALNSHALILPSLLNPSGALLTPRQNLFITSEHEGTTTLLGGYGSGKSTLLIRKALIHILTHPQDKVMIITPTLLGGELLRNELVSLLEYGALRVNVNAFVFYTPGDDLKILLEASMILCDDAHLMEESFLRKLEMQRGTRQLLLTSALPIESENIFELSGRFRRAPSPKTLCSIPDRLIVTLLVNLRKILKHAVFTDLLIVVSDDREATMYKEAVDEYFHLNCRILTAAFSLQYQDLDSIIITTPHFCAPISRAHVIAIGIDPSDTNYPLVLSRASESLTIITCENPIRGDTTDENTKN